MGTLIFPNEEGIVISSSTIIKPADTAKGPRLCNKSNDNPLIGTSAEKDSEGDVVVVLKFIDIIISIDFVKESQL